MRILYITLENLDLQKGSVIHVKEIVAGLRKLGHQVGLIACSWSGWERVDHFYNLHHLSLLQRFLGLKRQPYFISSIFLFLHLLKILPGYDIIYVREYHTVTTAFFPRFIFGKKLVFEVNGLGNEEQKLKKHSVLNRISVFLIQRAESAATRYSDRIICVTPQLASYLIRHFNCDSRKVEIVSNGVNIENFCPVHDKALLAGWRMNLGIAQDERVVVFVGNLALWQGVNILVESGIRLLSKEEKLRILIIGDGILKADLMKRVLSSGLEKKFIFTGMMNYADIPILINLADICVAPFISKRNQETGVSPLKIFEYMACGKPIVSTRINGLEFIETEGVGRLIDPENVPALEGALHDLLKAPEKRINMGSRGIQVVREKYSWESKVAEIAKILGTLA
jgi:glycosyltransferase involved in cell wall biosynthesis